MKPETTADKVARFLAVFDTEGENPLPMWRVTRVRQTKRCETYSIFQVIYDFGCEGEVLGGKLQLFGEISARDLRTMRADTRFMFEYGQIVLASDPDRTGPK